MTQSVTIRFRGKSYQCNRDETVLECLHRHRVEVPFCCQSGLCLTCLMRAKSGAPPAEAQSGLQDTQIERGYFLACICRPTEAMDVVITGEDPPSYVKAQVTGVTPLSEKIYRIMLKPEQPMSYCAGQYINIRRRDGQIRSYSVASRPEDEDLELHIRSLPGGAFSDWLINDNKPGDVIDIEGPHGDCFYSSQTQTGKPLLLVGSGTGLCPLWGILHDAIARGHTGPIHLFHGSYDRSGLYLIEELRAMEEELATFHYHPCVDKAGEGEDLIVGRVDQVLGDAIPDLQGWGLYICGNPGMVEATKKVAFMSGASLADIHADPYG